VTSTSFTAEHGPLETAAVCGRLFVGGGAVVAPTVLARAFGVPADSASPSVYLGRLFGARAVLMAVMLYRSSGAARRQQLRLALAVDLVDAWSAAAAGRAHQLSPQAARRAVGAALLEVGLGAAMLAGADRRRR
jgi:hypothetical protein